MNRAFDPPVMQQLWPPGDRLAELAATTARPARGRHLRARVRLAAAQDPL